MPSPQYYTTSHTREAVKQSVAIFETSKLREILSIIQRAEILAVFSYNQRSDDRRIPIGTLDDISYAELGLITPRFGDITRRGRIAINMVTLCDEALQADKLVPVSLEPFVEISLEELSARAEPN